MATLALTNARILDGRSAAPLEPGTLLIQDTLIEAVGPAAQVPIPAGCRTVDLQQATLLPTLMDGHMHVTPEPGPLDHLGHLKVNLQAVARLQQCLRWGAGVVGHAAGARENLVLRDLIAGGQLPGCADLLVSGAIAATGGHVRVRCADGPWEIRKAVREMAAAGVDFIKTCASGGFQWEHEQLSHEDYTREELTALADEAHMRGLRVHVHAHAQPGLRNAIAAGCDVILHGAHIDEEALQGIAAKGLWYMPTLHITSPEARAGKNWPRFMTERMERAHPIHCAGVARAHALGIKLVTGTDGGPGSLMNELRLLVACGLSPLEALRAATRDTAEAFGIADKTGTLEPGRRADLLAVRGNPLTDIALLMDQAAILWVMKAGQVYRPDPGL